MADLGDTPVTTEASARVSNADLQESLSDHLKKTVEGYKEATPEAVEMDGLQEQETPEQEAERLAKERKEPKEETPDETIEPKEEVEEGEKQEDKPEPEEEGEEEVEGDDKEPEPGKPVPYERFTEVVEKRNEYQRELEMVKPMVENYNRITTFCQQYQITPQQFEQVMKAQALLNTNPEEALKNLLPIVEKLQGYAGNKLPDDLQKRVDLGKLELDDAREMARLRAQLQHKEAMTKLSEEQLQQQGRQRFEQECAREAMTWEKAKRASDPDYMPKKRESDPDGKWEDVRDKYIALLNQVDARGNLVNPTQTTDQMVALMEKAYKLVNGKYTAINGRKTATRKPLRSTSAPGGERAVRIEDAKTMSEAIAIGLKQRAG